jgi:hypothetical protein
MTAIRAKANIAALPPAEQVLANTLLSLIESKLREDVGTSPLAGGKLLVVAEIAGWIKEAAATVAGPVPTA